MNAKVLHVAKCRQCTKCGNWYPLTLDYWTRDRHRKDGLAAWCKGCNSIRNSVGRPIQGQRGNAGRTVGQDVTQQIMTIFYTELVNQNQLLQPYFHLATVVQEQVNRITEKQDGRSDASGSDS